jgi:hypothetical protein
LSTTLDFLNLTGSLATGKNNWIYFIVEDQEVAVANERDMKGQKGMRNKINRMRRF